MLKARKKQATGLRSAPTVAAAARVIPAFQHSGSFSEAIPYLAVVAATVLAYLPAVTGSLLWDDDAHLTRPALHGPDPSAQRYSPLKQTDPTNVAKFVEAWRFETRPAAETGNKRASGTTPLMVNGVLNFATPYQSLVAVEPETGKMIWTFHQHAPRTSRGLAYWPGDRNSPPSIYFGTEDGFLIAVNVRTGKLVAGFAKEGELDLKAGMNDELPSAPY